MKKIAYFSNTDFSLYNFRKELMLEMKKNGFEIFAIASQTNKEISDKIKKEGINFLNIPLKRGLDFWGRDLFYFFRVFFLSKKEKFFLCHNFTIKSCIFATLAQKLAGIKNIYCTITGLGYTFERKNILNHLVIFLYKISLKFANRVFFLNPEDRNFFLELNIIKEEKAKLILSEGVDTEYFKKENIEKNEIEKLKKLFNAQEIVITLISRILWAKGIKEFKEAAEILKKKYSNLDFLLVGPIDKENPSGIPREIIEKWDKKGIIKYLEERRDIREILFFSDIIVLPSYYEGVPKILLEAGSMEKPLIATNIPGCKEVVKNNENGFLIKPKNSKELVEKIEILIKNKDLRKKFGNKSREIIEKEFDVKKIIKKIIEVYNIKNI